MLSPEIVPQEPEGLAGLFVQMPPLAQDSARSCPVEPDELAELVGEELGEVVGAEQLVFARTAVFDEVQYWTWRLDEVGEGSAWVVVALDDDGEATFGCFVDRWGLTAEQAIVGDHFGVV